MEIGTVIVVLVLGFVAWKLLTGLIKIGAIVLLVAAGAYVLANGGIG